MSLTLFTKEKSRRLSRRVISLTLSTALAVNSLLAGMPIINTAEAVTESTITNGYFAIDDSGFNVGFTANNFQDVTSVTVSLKKADDTILATNVGKQPLFNLIESQTSIGISTPFYIPNAKPDSSYWEYGDRTSWVKDDDPSKAVVTIVDNGTPVTLTISPYTVNESTPAAAYDGLICSYDFNGDAMWEITWGYGFDDRNGGATIFNTQSYGGLVAINGAPVPSYITNHDEDNSKKWQWLYIRDNGNYEPRHIEYSFADGTVKAVDYSWTVMNGCHIPNNITWSTLPSLSASANYINHAEYDGISLEIKTPNLTDGTDVEITVERTNGTPDVWTNKPSGTVMNALNTGSHTATAPIVIAEGTRTRTSSGSWQTTGEPWNGSQTPTSITVKVNRAGGAPALVETIPVIGSVWGTTWSSISEQLPQITHVDAYYSKGSGYTAISTDFTTKNIVDATKVELRVNRSDSSTYSITAKQSVLDAISNNSPKTTTGVIVITGSRTSGSWNDQEGTWSGPVLPESVDVIITQANGTILTMRDNIIGETLASQSEVLPADNTAPSTPTITAPSARQWFKTKPIVNSWTASTDDFGVIDHYQVAYLYDDGHKFSGSTCTGLVLGGKQVSGCRDVAGNQTSRNHNPGDWEQGGVTIWVRAFDSAGNASPWSKSVHYYYDIEAPVGDITAPTNGQLVGTANENGKLTVKGTVTDNLSMNRVGVQLVKPGVSGDIKYNTIHMVNQNPGVWATEFDVNALGLSDGEYGINLYFVDMVGNVSTKSIKFNLDNTFPTFSITSPANNEVVNDIITIDAVVEDANDITKLLFNVGGKANSWTNGNSSTITRNGNVFSVTIDTNTLPDGPTYVVLRATDGAGNVRYWNNNASHRQHVFVIDNTAPELSGAVLNMQNVANSDVRSENCTIPSKFHLVNGKIDLNAVIADATSSVASATYKIRKVSAGGCTQTAIYQSSSAKMINDGGNDWITLQSTTIDTAADANLVDGNYTIQITLKDSLGNQSTRYIDITVDNTAPAQPEVLGFYKNQDTSSEIIPCGGFTNNTKIQIDWADNVESDIAGYWFGTKNNAKHKWVKTGSFYNGDITPGNNSYYYTVIAVDHAGNESVISEKCELTLDQEAPVADITSHDHGDTVKGIVNLVGKVGDANPMNSHFRITGPNGYVKTSTFKDGRLEHKLSWNTTTLVDGLYTIQFEVRDQAGNKAAPGVSVDRIVVEVKNTPVVTGDYFVAEDGQLNVGFYVQGFTDANKVTVTLYDVEDNALTVNQGDSSLILALLNINPTDGISSQFYIPNGDDTDGYWDFGNPDWLSINKPYYAIVRVESGLYGEIESDKIYFQSPGERGFSYEELIAAIEEEEDEGGEVEGATKGKSNAQKGLQVAANRTNNNQAKGNNQGRGHEQVSYLLSQTSNDSVDDQDESNPGNGDNEEEAQDQAGKVAGESSSSEFKAVGAANDESCANLFGVCWYWYVPVVIAMTGGYFYYNNRRRDQAINSRLRR